MIPTLKYHSIDPLEFRKIVDSVPSPELRKILYEAKFLMDEYFILVNMARVGKSVSMLLLAKIFDRFQKLSIELLSYAKEHFTSSTYKELKDEIRVILEYASRIGGKYGGELSRYALLLANSIFAFVHLYVFKPISILAKDVDKIYAMSYEDRIREVVGMVPKPSEILKVEQK